MKASETAGINKQGYATN